MSGAHLDSPASALHSLSQISFRLSQRPPSNQRKSRRQLERTDSIEDSDASDRMSLGTPSQENNTARHNRLTVVEKTTVDSIFNCTDPPTLSSPVLSFASTASLRPLETPSHQKQLHRVPLSNIRSRNDTALVGRHVLQPNTSPISNRGNAADSFYRISAPAPCLQPYSPGSGTDHGLLRTPQTEMHLHLRPISTHRQAISPQSAPPDRNRSVTSRRPDITMATVPGLATQRAAPVATPEHLKVHHALIHGTSSKRPRHEGIAASEFRKAVSQEVSEFCMWWHCLSGESGPSRVCHRPQASFRLRIQSVQCIVQPHLFSVEAVVEDVISAEASSSIIASGKPMTALLSVAVFMDALPLEAKRVAEKFKALEAGIGPAVELSDSENHPLVVAVYEPWRVQLNGNNEQLCVLASRFNLV